MAQRRRLIGFEPAPEPPFTTSRHYAITQPEPAIRSMIAAQPPSA
jgi:hypothetical protein